MAIAMTFFLGIASFALVLTLFLQLGLGFTPLHAGLTFLPFSLGVLVSSGAAARLAPRFGRGVTMAGALIIAAGMTGLIAAVHHYGAAVTTWDLVPGLVGAGLGLGAVIAPLADIVLDGVSHQDAGSASGVFNTGLQLGNSIGIAVIGVIFFALLGTQSGAAANTVVPALRSGAVAAGVPARDAGALVAQFRTCLHDRLVAADPTVTPASCRPRAGEVLPAAVRPVLARAGGAAVRADFIASVARTLWFQVGVFGLSFLLMLAWPRGAGRRIRGSGDGDAAADAAASTAATGGRSAARAATAAAVPARPAIPFGAKQAT
jgi:MFS family permease